MGSRLPRGFCRPISATPTISLYYDSYDLAPYLQVGENVIGLQLGNGMQNAFGGYVWDFEKGGLAFCPQGGSLCGDYGCGRHRNGFEADEAFRCAPSPIYYDDLRMGERYDARAEIPGWSLPGFDDSDWERAFFSEAPPWGRPGFVRPAPLKPGKS